MTQVITTPDGVEHEFPDGASDDVIKNALKSYSSGSKPPATAMPAALTYDTTDPNSSWGSWALSKLHNAAVGGNLWNKVFQDSATFGGADVLQGKIAGSPSTDELRAQTEEAKKQIGPVGSATAELSGYAMVPGGLKVGEGLAGLAGGGKLARIGGSMLEGAGASGLGTAGHGGSWEDTGKSALVGGGIGAITGALPGGAGKRPVTPPTADLQATAQEAFAPLKGKVYQAPGVSDVIDRTTSGMSAGDAMTMGQKLRDARDVMAREVADRPTITADDVAKFNRELGKAAGGSGERQRIAQQYVDALNKGVGSKTAADIAGANRASNIAKTGAEIEGWAAAPGSAPKAVRSALENNPDFYKAQPGLFDALNAVGKKAPSADPSISSEVSKVIAKHLIGAGIGAGVGYTLGNNPYGDIAGAAAGAALPLLGGRLAAIPTRNALLAAQHLNATGAKINPGVYTPQWMQIPGILARQGGYAAGASGRLNPQANQ